MNANDLEPQLLPARAPRDWDRFTAIASVFIAVLSLGMTLWQGVIDRDHDKLSVKPLLYLERNIHKEKETLSLIAYNNGVGPAIVREGTLSVDGKPVAGWQAALDAVGLEQNCFATEGALTRIYRPGDSQILLAISEDRRCKKSFEELVAGLRRIKLRLIYQSLYEEPFVAEDAIWAD